MKKDKLAFLFYLFFFSLFYRNRIAYLGSFMFYSLEGSACILVYKLNPKQMSLEILSTPSTLHAQQNGPSQWVYRLGPLIPGICFNVQIKSENSHVFVSNDVCKI